MCCAVKSIFIEVEVLQNAEFFAVNPYNDNEYVTLEQYVELLENFPVYATVYELLWKTGKKNIWKVRQKKYERTRRAIDGQNCKTTR